MEQEIYPLILDGEQAGEAAVRREGGWTVFDVRCRAMEGILRVSAWGGGREGYLGVLAPEGDGLALHRRFSRNELREFPAAIEYIGRAGVPCTAPTEQAEEAERKPGTERNTAQPPEAEAPPCAEPESGPGPEPEPPPCADAAEKEQTPPALGDVYWYASPDGALVSFDGQRNLIALPEGDPRMPEGPGGRRQTIEGRTYVVFETKDGRLIR